MSRWWVLAVTSVAFSAIGCGSSLKDAASVQVGLSNAPNLGGSPQAEGRASGVVANGVTDVVANGSESCGRYAESGVLWNQWPACPKPTPYHGNQTATAAPTANDPTHGLVQPWLNHFYTGWPCAEASGSGRKTRAWSAMDTSNVACAVPDGK
jgi:hypothetical protein